MMGVFSVLLWLGAAVPVEGTLAVLPAHTPSGDVLDAHDGLVAATATAARERGLTVVDAEIIDGVLVAVAEQGLRCRDATCFAQVGAFTGADVVVVPIVDNGRVELLRVAVAAGGPTRRLVVAPDRAAEAIEALLSGESLPARVMLDGPPGATVVVDGAPRGSFPLELTLAPGRHTFCAPPNDGPCGEQSVRLLADGEEVTLVLAPALAPAESGEDAAPTAPSPPRPVNAVDVAGPAAEASPLPVRLYAGAGVLAGGVALAVLAGAVGAIGYGVRFFGRPWMHAEGRLVSGLVGDGAMTVALVVLVGAGATGGALLLWQGVRDE